jgi:hypothetical protein
LPFHRFKRKIYNTIFEEKKKITQEKSKEINFAAIKKEKNLKNNIFNDILHLSRRENN